jgi:hypothetical protein
MNASNRAIDHLSDRSRPDNYFRLKVHHGADRLPRLVGDGARKAVAPQDCRWGYLMTAAPTFATTSSCEPVPPEQPIAPMSFPFSTSGMPPREAMTPSIVTT